MLNIYVNDIRTYCVVVFCLFENIITLKLGIFETAWYVQVDGSRNFFSRKRSVEHVFNPILSKPCVGVYRVTPSEVNFLKKVHVRLAELMKLFLIIFH